MKFILMMLLAVTVLHGSGVEMAFCDDSSAQTESHGCVSCQPSHPSAITQQPAVTFMEIPSAFISSENLVFSLQEPTRFILRPPISL